MYAKNGNNVYSYYLDVETQEGFRSVFQLKSLSFQLKSLSKTIQYDYLIRDKPYYPGTGHAHELHYVWGSTKYDLYRVLMHGLEPEDFEHDLTFLFESQWNRFSHRGEPWINWQPVEENCETLVINKDKVSFSKLKLIFTIQYSRYCINTDPITN